MLLLKIHIARFLIVFGFMLNLGNYVVELVDFYNGDIASISYAMEDTEDKSESKEKDTEDKSESKEKDKISQYVNDKTTGISILELKDYPEFYFRLSSVYLEYNTPPPEYL